MDQLKEILRQAIKYRFWIAVGFSAMLPIIAYFMGVGPIQKAAKDETGKITTAKKSVDVYSSGVLPNAQYKGIVGEKTEELSDDVSKSWKKLYDRQAPLLTWPDRVNDKFRTWGRKWPENVDPGAVQLTIIDYVNAYPAFVTEVYKSFRPFDPIEATGIVTSPPEEALLRPSKFTIEAPPSLGKVWAAQERLWIQRTLLDVIAQVNKNAKDWDGAVVKQVNMLEVGTPSAQDQRSIAKGEVPEKAEDLVDPSKPVEETADAGNAAGGGMESMMRGMMGGGRMGGAAANTEEVHYLKNESTQFKVMPVQMSVLIDQEHIQDFLIALENSPMSIQVMDFELSKPSTRVVKPEKNMSMSFGYGDAGGMGGMMGMMGRGGMSGFGGNFMRGGMMGRGGMSGMGGMSESMMKGAMGGGGMMGGAAAPQRKGVDARTKDRAKDAAAAVKAVKSAATASMHDPYYYIVEVKIYGQARFFNPPPAEAPVEPSQAEAEKPADPAAATEGDAPKKAGVEAEKKADAAGDAEKKADGAVEKKADEATEKKAQEPKKAEPSKAEDKPKAEETKPDSPAPESKNESTKAEVAVPKTASPAPK